MFTPTKHKQALWLFPLLMLALALGIGASGASSSSATPLDSCPGERFSDVCSSDWFYQPVMNLSGMNILSGYADGTFLPYNNVTRGQAMKVIVMSANLTGNVPTNPTFADVPATQTFFRWIELGSANGIVNGYQCGGPGEPCDAQSRPYFRPGSNVTRGQLSKMIVGAFHWQPATPETATFNDVPAGSTFFGFIERAVRYDVLNGYDCGQGAPCPGRYFLPGNTATRAQAAKIIDKARLFRIIPAPVPTGLAATPSPTQVVGSTPTRPVGELCPMFPADNIWNRNIASLPVHPLSVSYMASIGLTAPVHPDFGSGLWNGGPIGIPFVGVLGDQPRVPINFTEYGAESDPGPYPVNPNAPIEGGRNSTGDRHVLVQDTDSCLLFEMYHAYPQADGSWNAGSGARYSLTSNALRPAGWTSADAAGLPIMPGLVRYAEVANGAIRHALRFTAPRTQRAYLWPARHFASSSSDPTLPPMGLRVRLKSNVDISGYPAQVRVILQGLKDYGMLLADNGSPWYISGAPDERWDNDILRSMQNLHGTDFEAVDESGLMVDPNSGQSR